MEVSEAGDGDGVEKGRDGKGVGMDMVEDADWGGIGYYSDAIMSAMASKIAWATIVYATVCSGADQSKHQSSASLAFVREIHRWSVNSPHRGPVTRKMFPFDDVIMNWKCTLKNLSIPFHSDAVRGCCHVRGGLCRKRTVPYSYNPVSYLMELQA